MSLRKSGDGPNLASYKLMLLNGRIKDTLRSNYLSKYRHSWLNPLWRDWYMRTDMKKKYRVATVYLLLFIFGFIVVSAVFGDETGTAISGFIPVPEPSSILLMGVGMVGLAGLGRKKFKR
jgi:hypothetical protein